MCHDLIGSRVAAEEVTGEVMCENANAITLSELDALFFLFF